jgi:hypothetical protein
MSARHWLHLAFAVNLLLPTTAHAQLFRAYLAPDGSDTNPCTLAAPCRLLPAALNAVADKGEIWMLDSANYNNATVFITKNVSILAVPGAVGSIVATGGPAISIGAGIGGAGITVALRNVVIVPLYDSGTTTGTYGIVSPVNATLSVEHSLIANLPVHAVWGSGTVRIANSILRNNGGYGLSLSSGGRGEVVSTQMLGNFSGGVFVYQSSGSSTSVTVSDSAITGGTYGVSAQTTESGALAQITVTRSVISQTKYPVQSTTTGAGSAAVSINDCTVTGNTYAWVQAGEGSVIRTMGNNQITDNVNPGIGSLTPTALQ